MHYSIQLSQRLKKLIRSLHQRTSREQNHLFVAEGNKLCYELQKCDYRVELLVIRDSPSSDIIDVVEHYIDKGVAIYHAPKHLFDQLCDTKTPQGILAVVNYKDQIIMPKENFIALDGISDPGNIGTIIRTAEWFGINQILFSPECADAFGPKAVRSSMGSVFRTQIIDTENLGTYIKENFPKAKLIGASLDATKELSDLKKPKSQFGLVFGSESHGISKEMLSNLDEKYIIKGVGNGESLNVSVSVGISLNHFSHKN